MTAAEITEKRAFEFASVLLDLEPTVYDTVHRITKKYHKQAKKNMTVARDEFRDRLATAVRITKIDPQKAKFVSVDDVLLKLEKLPDTRDDEAAVLHRRHVGKSLSTLRNQKHLTQEQLEKKTGIHQTHISKIENGLLTPTYKTVAALAKALGARPCDIDPSFMEVGERIRSIREAKGMKLWELAQKTGLTVRQIESIEDDALILKRAGVSRLAKALDVRETEIDPGFNL